MSTWGNARGEKAQAQLPQGQKSTPSPGVPSLSSSPRLGQAEWGHPFRYSRANLPCRSCSGAKRGPSTAPSSCQGQCLCSPWAQGNRPSQGDHPSTAKPSSYYINYVIIHCTSKHFKQLHFQANLTPCLQSPP